MAESKKLNSLKTARRGPDHPRKSGYPSVYIVTDLAAGRDLGSLVAIDVIFCCREAPPASAESLTPESAVVSAFL